MERSERAYGMCQLAAKRAEIQLLGCVLVDVLAEDGRCLAEIQICVDGGLVDGRLDDDGGERGGFRIRDMLESRSLRAENRGEP